MQVLSISLGYFTYDCICCEIIERDFANLAHHLCTMLGLWVGVCQGRVRQCATGAPGSPVHIALLLHWPFVATAVLITVLLLCCRPSLLLNRRHQ